MNNLKHEKRWLCWKFEDNSKKPCSAYTKYFASYKDPKNLSDFEQATKNAEKYHLSGVGVSLGNGIAGIDLDHCIDDDGNFSEFAKEILSCVNSYAEFSPRGHGLHIIFKYQGDKPNKKTDTIEFYTGDRYFTFTGKTIKDASGNIRDTLNDCTAAANEVFEKYCVVEESQKEDLFSNEKKSAALFADTIRKATPPKEAITKYKDAYDYILENPELILTDAPAANTKICPLCGHGSRENKNGMHFKRNDAGVKLGYCYSCNDKERGIWKSNTYDIVGKAFDLDLFENKFVKSCELFGIDINLISDYPFKATPPEIEFNDPLKSDFFYLDEFTKATREQPKEIISTGFKNLDEVLSGGFYNGLYILGAISSLGKTTFLLQLAANISRQQKDVLIFSLEMSRNELIAKGVSRETALICEKEKLPLSLAKTTRGIMTPTFYETYNAQELDLIEKAKNAYKQYANHIFTIEGIGDISHKEIRKAITAHKAFTGNTPFIFIDYTQILAPTNERATDKQNIDKNVLELKRISRDFETVVFCVSSFNRENYNNAVTMQAFKESGAIEYSSDFLIGIQLQGAGKKNKKGDCLFNVDAAKQKEPREVELKILKNRNGKTGASLFFDYYAKFNLFKEREKLYRNEEDLRKEILNILENNQNGAPLLLVEICNQLKQSDGETIKFILENNGYKVTRGGYVEAAQSKDARQKAAILNAFNALQKDGKTTIREICEYLEIRPPKLKKDIRELFLPLAVDGEFLKSKD